MKNAGMIPPIEVYGINLLVQLVADETVPIKIRCPKGATILYGRVVARGDGFDADGNVFRALPYFGAVVAFEEGENVIGHNFELAGHVYRLITLDDVLASFPQPWK